MKPGDLKYYSIFDIKEKIIFLAFDDYKPMSDGFTICHVLFLSTNELILVHKINLYDII
jgi:hypothetical protein